MWVCKYDERQSTVAHWALRDQAGTQLMRQPPLRAPSCPRGSVWGAGPGLAVSWRHGGTSAARAHCSRRPGAGSFVGSVCRECPLLSGRVSPLSGRVSPRGRARAPRSRPGPRTNARGPGRDPGPQFAAIARGTLPGPRPGPGAVPVSIGPGGSESAPSGCSRMIGWAAKKQARPLTRPAQPGPALSGTGNQVPTLVR